MVGQHTYRRLCRVLGKVAGRTSALATVRFVPVEFLTDEQAEAYGAFTDVPTRPELERFFFLDEDDRDLIALRRTDAHRLGVAVQICTVRYVGRFPW